jgi:thiamine-phosphate pyrophosphorylase
MAPSSKLPRLYLISDRRLCASLPKTFGEIAREAPRGSVSFQVREKDLSAEALYRLTAQIVAAVRPSGASLFVNDRADVARCAGADGVHLSGRSVFAKDALRLGLLVGVSTHNAPEVDAAVGALFCTFGPIYDTPSKRSLGSPVGTAALAACSQRGLPLYALGGVTKEKIPQLLANGAAGVAVISAVLAQPSPVKSALALLEELYQR